MPTSHIRPPSLKPGDTIGILAPARKVSRDEMAPAIDIIRQWGYRVSEGRHLYGEQHQFSGTDEERASDFQAMLDDEDVRAIFCARGGYGTARIIDRLDFSRFRENPKWIVGYSDITVFHSHISRHYGIQTLHAAMPINFPADRQMNDSLTSLKEILEGKSPEYNLHTHSFNRPGGAKGILCGGNLSMIYSLSGTPSDIDTGGKILFIEDLDEYLYHVDRMMLNLKRSGKLENLAGMVVGGMSDMNDNDIPFGQTACEIIAGHVSAYSYPVLFDFPAGHIRKNLALVMGGAYELEAGKEPGLKLLP
jgi:muramoyltetrapeptide carboxypeptidase